ncbi:MAG: glycosyltransferase family 2 protein [Actinomycetota bacterium]
MIPEIVAGLLPAAVLLDGQNLVAPFRKVLEPITTAPSNDFTILVPLYGDPKYLRNEAYLSRYRENVLLVINTATEVMAAFAERKEKEGWRVARASGDARHSPAHMMIIGLEHVTTTYVIRLDGDTETIEHPGAAIAAMSADSADFCSVKVVPTSRATIAEKLQGVEYDMAMLARHNAPWMTSGACMMGRTDAWQRIMERHSLYFFGEDVESGRLAKWLGMRVRHIDFAAYTDVPQTFRALFRQRRGWWCGAFRQTIINADKNLRFPIWSLYYLGLVYLLLAGKLNATLTDPTVLPTLTLVYVVLTLLANWPVRSRWMIVFPFYSLAQALVMPAVGFVHWVRVLASTRAHGRYRISTLRTLIPALSRRAS